MTTLDKIKNFLFNTKDISLGYNELNFIQPDNLDEEQIGYSIDTYGNSLITGNKGDWQEEWLVIASDQLGDPIIVNVSTPRLTVLSAAHGEGAWEPFVIADSLDNFGDILTILDKLSKKRTNPVDLEKYPISDKEKQNALAKIAEQNPNAELWYWKTSLIIIRFGKKVSRQHQFASVAADEQRVGNRISIKLFNKFRLSDHRLPLLKASCENHYRPC